MTTHHTCPCTTSQSRAQIKMLTSVFTTRLVPSTRNSTPSRKWLPEVWSNENIAETLETTCTNVSFSHEKSQEHKHTFGKSGPHQGAFSGVKNRAPIPGRRTFAVPKRLSGRLFFTCLPQADQTSHMSLFGICLFPFCDVRNNACFQQRAWLVDTLGVYLDFGISKLFCFVFPLKRGQTKEKRLLPGGAFCRIAPLPKTR